MYIKIYFDNKPLFLCDAVDETIAPYMHHDDAVFIDELNSHTVKSMIHEMQVDKVHAGVFLHDDLEVLRKAFYKKFTLVQAAGGLVENENGEILMIFRRGKWDLPKGKLDKGETLEACAVREVEEETGLQRIQLLTALPVTYHTYHEGSKYILKESYWYHMKVEGPQQLIPQVGEGIDQVKWVSRERAREYYPDAFPSVLDVMEAFLR
ncbi:MAG: NUDIX domain-containing protein [Chitinophagaceae bacterium]|nr:NUDIX domain-containing protein [Chitinophagaceae bacterium]